MTTIHLTESSTAELGRELDQIREEIIAERGETDARYIHRVIAVQRGLELGGRTALRVSLLPPAWLAGTAMLSTAKTLAIMELGHNIMHGQWDWMRDPQIHSTTWEWDFVSPSESWKYSHNYIHHTFTNVLGKDRDIGYGWLRVSPEQPWHPIYLVQPAYNLLLAAFFEWGIALYDLELENILRGRKSWKTGFSELLGILRKARRQSLKDYLLFPLMSGPSFLPALTGNAAANLVRNVWAHTVIFCGHFPEGAEVFTEEQLDGETRGDWYVRQVLGSCNIDGGPLLHLMSGNLSHQIEHHLFPDLPSNRYAEIAPRVRALCERYGLPYNTGPLHHQYGTVWKRILRLALPCSAGAANDAPVPATAPGTGSPPGARRGLSGTGPSQPTCRAGR